MESTVKLDVEHGDPFPDVSLYRSIVGKLIYLIVPRPSITYVVGIVSQYMDAPCQPHFDVVCEIVRYLKSTWSRIAISAF